jgi:two-component system, NarL family, invasion response regulator UvrY
MTVLSPIKVALVDDHKLFRKGMVELINAFTGYRVIWEANHGKELIEKVSKEESPDVVLLDITMPQMDGYETAQWLKVHFPKIKILALSMYDQEDSIIRMFKSGATGYILKDAEPSELKAALQEMASKGFFFSPLVSNAFLNSMYKETQENKPTQQVTLSGRETEFLKLACTELTYKEIADKMCLASRTIDGYRESLFEKLGVKNRVGLVLYAIKHGIVKIL